MMLALHIFASCCLVSVGAVLHGLITARPTNPADDIDWENHQ